MEEDGQIMEKVGIYTVIGGSAFMLSCINFLIAIQFDTQARRVLTVLPITIIGVGTSIIGGGRLLQRNKTSRDFVEASGLVLLGTSIITVPLTLVLIDDLASYQRVIFAELELGILGALMVGLAEDRANIVKWKD
jgi:hypothetical protein